jgi:hypothetical protein
MKKLTKAQLRTRDEHACNIRSKGEVLAEAVQAFNEKLEAAWVDVEAARDELNEEIDNANQFRSEVYDAADSYFSDRSERWQDGDAGQAYQEFMGQWEEELEQVEVERPDDVSEPEGWEAAADKLEEYPESSN